ncbi:MAG TPA: thiaminase II [Dehalococcoidia bacterium]|nr:thiaminase II [Dehalococcoidia bacterium]
MSERFTDRLRSLADEVWQAQHMHPFVRGIGTGTVDREQFKHWVRQDYLFLVEYGRLLALAAARAPDLETMRRFADLTQSTLGTEMDLHRSYAAEFGITEAELEEEVMSPTTRAYTDFLLRCATVGDYVELVAALLPCMWGFSEIGRELARAGMPSDPLCAKWIEMYASEDFAALADWCRDLLDDLAEHLPPVEQDRLARIFLTSSRYELMFWDMARNLERWPE